MTIFLGPQHLCARAPDIRVHRAGSQLTNKSSCDSDIDGDSDSGKGWCQGGGCLCTLNQPPTSELLFSHQIPCKVSWHVIRILLQDSQHPDYITKSPDIRTMLQDSQHPDYITKSPDIRTMLQVSRSVLSKWSCNLDTHSKYVAQATFMWRLCSMTICHIL